MQSPGHFVEQVVEEFFCDGQKYHERIGKPKDFICKMIFSTERAGQAAMCASILYCT